ncbi:MAG TPA: dihydrodipicolinate synthase family protein [Symbiobacteriaceae bacterium]|nr:dihydrodipicolinate synthase family protein [Symbiobacteriaceae bacterium]
MTLYGVIPAVLTPFDASGEVNTRLLDNYVKWLVKKGVHGLFPCGTNGEGPVMTIEQRITVMNTVAMAAGGRPVVPMTGSISTAETIVLTREAQQMGADGAAVVAPYYFPADDMALEAHFSAVAEAVPDFPLYLYDIPGNAKNAISPALAAKLAERYPAIQGVKDSSKSLDKLKQFVAAMPGKTVIVGTDAMVLEAMAAGAKGVVSAIADCFPEVMVALYNAIVGGETDKAAELQAQVVQLRDALKRGPYVHPYKLAVQWRGLEFGTMRAPLRECTPEEAAGIRAALEEGGFLA